MSFRQYAKRKQTDFLPGISFWEGQSIVETKAKGKKKTKENPKSQKKDTRSQGIFPHQVNNKLNSETNKGNLHKQDLQCHVPVAQ